MVVGVLATVLKMQKWSVKPKIGCVTKKKNIFFSCIGFFLNKNILKVTLNNNQHDLVTIDGHPIEFEIEILKN